MCCSKKLLRYKEKDTHVGKIIDALQNVINGDILDMDSVVSMIMDYKRAKVQNIHKYKITTPKSENARWQTYIKKEGETRRSVKAQSEEELYEKLYNMYFEENTSETNSKAKKRSKKTVYSLYLEWLEYKKTITDSNNTIKRHKQHYAKYFEKSVLHNKDIAEIESIWLEQQCNTIVKSNNLTRKEWVNIKTILSGMFRYAVRKGYITANPMSDIEIHVKFKQVVRKTSRTETYNTQELDALLEYIDTMYSKTKDAAFMAVKLNFLMGLRVGELVALKWSDIIEHDIHIVREEVRDQETNTYSVVEHTKTNRDRFVTLVPKAVDILNSIERKTEYIFTRDGERITSRQIAYVLEKYAERYNIKTKSTHKMRKTYASNLSARGVPHEIIREMLGHTNLQTTMSYIYNPLTKDETYEIMKNALQSKRS